MNTLMNITPIPSEMLTLGYWYLDVITTINYVIYDSHKLNFNVPG